MMKKILITASAMLLLSTAVAVVFADTTTTTNPNIGQPPTQPTPLSCVASAVAKRESAIQAAFSSFSLSWSSALTKRASDLAAAWLMPERHERNVAIRTAWRTFITAKKEARNTYNDARKAAWKQFSDDRKDCGKRAPGSEDNAGADAL